MKNSNNLPFSKINYALMVLGICTITTGFILIALDKEAYGFGTLGITIGPLTVLSGLAIEFIAILYDNKK